jgi:hypothetical protein
VKPENYIADVYGAVNAAVEIVRIMNKQLNK